MTKGAPKSKKKSGIPTGNAGEYFVMGELLRRGYDAQLADRNTKDYDLLVGRPEHETLRKVQVKSVRAPPWYVKATAFQKDFPAKTTVYVLLGKEDGKASVRYFVVPNRAVAQNVHHPEGWQLNGFMPLKAIEAYEDRWDLLAAN